MELKTEVEGCCETTLMEVWATADRWEGSFCSHSRVEPELEEPVCYVNCWLKVVSAKAIFICSDDVVVEVR